MPARRATSFRGRPSRALASASRRALTRPSRSRLERTTLSDSSWPCFIMAPDASAAKRKIARLQAEHGDRLPETLFVMICAEAKE